MTRANRDFIPDVLAVVDARPSDLLTVRIVNGHAEILAITRPGADGSPSAYLDIAAARKVQPWMVSGETVEDA